MITTGLDKMINERDTLKTQIEDNIPRQVEDRNVMVH